MGDRRIEFALYFLKQTTSVPPQTFEVKTLWLMNQLGVAGEYLAAGELSLKGWVSSITLRNSRGIDIIASNPEGTKSVSVQVKTNSDGANKWILSKKSEEYFSVNHVYIFDVIKGLGERPEYRIVPSERVARQIKVGH